MLHVLVPFLFAVIAFFVLALALYFERKRLVLLVRAQINFGNMEEASYDGPMKLWEALRSLRFTTGIRNGFLCRVFGDSLSGFGVADGDLLALQTVDKADIVSAHITDDGVIVLGSGLNLTPGKSIILLPFLQNGDSNAQRYSQKLRCFTSGSKNTSGAIEIFSRKLDVSGGEHTACHGLDAILGKAYANLTTSRFI